MGSSSATTAACDPRGLRAGRSATPMAQGLKTAVAGAVVEILYVATRTTARHDDPQRNHQRGQQHEEDHAEPIQGARGGWILDDNVEPEHWVTAGLSKGAWISCGGWRRSARATPPVLRPER